MPEQKTPSYSGKWVVAVMLAVSLLIAALRWMYVPRTNPKQADPGNPYYSPPPAQQSRDRQEANPPSK